ncbi:hypothetical protein JTE90_022732 [Oedothorax gibbosus]|uniref:Uncharacterized protein n=1 Tax=Oedothorax gibbosus TaxID=931172 RepID=A0AAV6UQY3_9ARAC|nr:hypothetical protein JTE90_022732 [Oedothorax gibbosus]
MDLRRLLSARAESERYLLDKEEAQPVSFSQGGKVTGENGICCPLAPRNVSFLNTNATTGGGPQGCRVVKVGKFVWMCHITSIASRSIRGTLGE